MLLLGGGGGGGATTTTRLRRPHRRRHWREGRDDWPRSGLPSRALSAGRLFQHRGGDARDICTEDSSSNNNNNRDDDDDDKNMTAPSLTEQLATRLVRGSARRRPPRPTKACVAVAGGGSAAASAIAATPGASSLLLESTVAYDRRSFAEFVSRCVEEEEPWLRDLERRVAEGETTSGSDETTTRGGPDSNPPSSGHGGRREFKFSSAEAAVLLSRAALRRSLELTPSFRDRGLHCVGVGCTSSLVGRVVDGEVVGGRKGRTSRAYVALSTLHEGTWVWEVRLDGGKDDGADGAMKGGGSKSKCMRRTRSEEESAVSNLVLMAMVRHREGRSHEPLDSIGMDDGDPDGVLRRIFDREGDSVKERTDLLRTDVGPKEGHKGNETSVAGGASRIIEGVADAVSVLPNEEGRRVEALFMDGDIPFPRDVLIVPGSFNPPHAGHVGLANAAAAALRRLRRREEEEGRDVAPSEDSSSSMRLLRRLWSTVGRRAEDRGSPAVFFEMSVTNADKPPLDPIEVERRVGLFAPLQAPEEGGPLLPEDWAILLTNAPLFSQKASVLDGLIPGGDPAGDGSGCGRRKMTFVLGTDTMVRIIDPKYYGNSREDMLAALRDMRGKGVHFIVGGRLEQGRGGRCGPIRVRETTFLPMRVAGK